MITLFVPKRHLPKNVFFGSVASFYFPRGFKKSIVLIDRDFRLLLALSRSTLVHSMNLNVLFQ